MKNENDLYNKDKTPEEDNKTNIQEKTNNYIPLTKKQNKKFAQRNKSKYYLFAALGLLNLIPLYYIIKKRNNLNDYNSSDISKVKENQKNVNF
ncbi:hypothetical protein BCR36DRAFT_71968 [Piromyces finnis]|uniref:Uncharacterized protein n=1 Tax=Piromyces finnis TaxID=1754191 RepID=A0A1Y1V6M9_9FUNG|nr:hypothetical protein BCR36DRAFT_71968 [Piromyces finnis]|eukprot:ORX48613.1 hypothetical protein BCR36DRAFT_71968 [Piromyces finnis]